MFDSVTTSRRPSSTGYALRLIALLVVLVLQWFAMTSAHAARGGSLETKLQSRFHEAVLKALDTADAEVHVSKIRIANPKLIQKGTQIRRFELTQTRRPFGSVAARVRFSAGGQTADAYVYAQVDARVPVWVMSATVDRGAPIHRLVQVEMRDASRLPHGTLMADAPLIGRIAARRLASGSPVTSRALTTPMLVRHGDQVKVVVRVGAVQIAANGTAMRDGRRGQFIPVRVRQGRVVQASVTGPRMVEVER